MGIRVRFIFRSVNTGFKYWTEYREVGELLELLNLFPCGSFSFSLLFQLHNFDEQLPGAFGSPSDFGAEERWSRYPVQMRTATAITGTANGSNARGFISLTPFPCECLQTRIHLRPR